VSLFENADPCRAARTSASLVDAFGNNLETSPIVKIFRSRTRDRFNPRSRQADVDDASDRLSDRLSIALS